MSLLAMVNEYQELLDEKDGLAEATKANNAAIETKKQEIAQQMIDDDCPKISCHGYTFSLASKTMYSKKSEVDLAAAEVDFFEVLREQGLGDLIKETVAPATLRKTVAEIVEEQGKMPEELAEVINSYDTFDITRRKEKNKALEAAKGGEK